MISEIPPDFLYHKKPSGQDRTAAERKYIAKAIRRRRGILQSRIHFFMIKDSEKYVNACIKAIFQVR